MRLREQQFFALMDAYGLELMSVQFWGILWGLLSPAFVVGGFLHQEDY
jgi:DHA3 family multidrug efflux protein-like MFS transporter